MKGNGCFKGKLSIGTKGILICTHGALNLEGSVDLYAYGI